ALDRPLLRRPGAGRGRKSVSSRRRRRPPVRRHRSSSVGAARVSAESYPRRNAMKDKDKTQLGRRDFLRVLGAGAAAAPLVATEAHADSETTDEKRKARYRETDHVKRFYTVNRYPN